MGAGSVGVGVGVGVVVGVGDDGGIRSVDNGFGNSDYCDNTNFINLISVDNGL